jgi:hypothetical protein
MFFNSRPLAVPREGTELAVVHREEQEENRRPMIQDIPFTTPNAAPRI